MGQIQSLDELLDLLRRRRWLIGLVLVIGVGLSLLIAANQPKTYTAAAVIQVELPMVTGPGAAAVGVRATQALQAIEQRLTTRENMLAMIARHGLFADEAHLTPDQKVALMRRTVQFQSVASVTQPGNGTPPGVSALIITASFGTADQAARIANDFAQSILDASAAGQAERTRDALRFFVEEAGRVGQELAALEAEIADYKRANADALPGTDAARRQEAIALETEIRALDQSLVALTGESAAIGKKSVVRETDRRQIKAVEDQIAVAVSQKAVLADRRAALATAIARTPEIDRMLAGYARRQQQLQDQYNMITTRLADAETNLRLEELQHDEHFSLLERAMTPEFPQRGGGRKIAALGAAGSLILALGLAFVLDVLNPVLRSAAQMERQLDLRPVISIPQVETVKPGAAAHTPPTGRTARMEGLPRSALLTAAAILLLIVAAAAIT